MSFFGQNVDDLVLHNVTGDEKWVEKGVSLAEFMEFESTVTADMYCKTFTKLTRAIQKR